MGKLNSSKGFDVFGDAIVKILNKYPTWKGLIIGDEPRQKYFFRHKNLINLGFRNNEFILKKLKEVSIATVPSKWEEPFGRSSLEAASRGCALIISNKGGLLETTQHALVLKDVTSKNLYKNIEYLIKNKNYRISLQKNAYKNLNYLMTILHLNR